MLILPLLFPLQFSTLQPGEDPYSILSISRDASSREIRAAYRQLTFKHHPDRNPHPDSNKVWSRINDAYEVLSNPDRKARYDRTGLFSDPPPHPSQPNVRYEPSTPSPPSEFHTPLITEQLFSHFLADDSEWLILIYQHFDCPTCKSQLDIWESAAKFLKDYVNVGRMDATQSPNLCDTLGITKVPQLIGARLLDGKYKVSMLSRSMKDVTRTLAIVYSHWRAKIESPGNLKKWIENKKGKVCVVLYTPLNSEDQFVDFRFVASKLNAKCAFAQVKGNAEWNISMYRAGQLGLSTVVKMRGKPLVDEIDDRSSPLFVRLTGQNYRDWCQEWCLGFISENVSDEILKDYHELPFNTVLVDVKSEFARKVNATSKDWVIFLGKQAWKVPTEMDRNSLFVILWELWKNGAASGLMKRTQFVDVPFLTQKKKGLFW
jgi:hypothetical protein